MRITIVGFGNIGKCLTSLLLQQIETELIINVLDIDDSIEGALLDFQHAIELYPHHKLTYNNQEQFIHSDFIFHCAGASVPIGKSRLDVCEESLEITRKVFKDFSPTKEPFIIVVANPVELICYYTQELTKLPKQKVVGTGTLLDSLRMNYIVKKEYPHLQNVNTVLLGEHGNSVFISHDLSQINREKVNKVLNQDEI